jgi:isoquinoline 1-oxidoreductase alpha subunit
MIMAAEKLLRDNPDPSDEDINDMVTNICRCGTYERVRSAIKGAASNMSGSPTLLGSI